MYYEQIISRPKENKVKKDKKDQMAQTRTIWNKLDEKKYPDDNMKILKRNRLL